MTDNTSSIETEEGVVQGTEPPVKENKIRRLMRHTKSNWRDWNEVKKWNAGTLQYTTMGLIGVFFWVLWGDFVFSVMESVFPRIVPLMMDELKSSKLLIGLVCTTLPSALNFVITPWVSFRSDRLRSKWGRRIPFLLFPTPFLTVFLILLGYSDVIGPYIHRTLFSTFGWSENAVTLAFLALMVVGFKYFDMFVGSVYYYLFNDVVPVEFLARFLSLFRIVGTLAGMAFNAWLFPKAVTHQHEVFLAAGLLYLVVFSLMCLKVKEGEYPPPPENVDGRTSVMSSIKTYFVECFGHRFYWWSFTATTLFAMSGAVGVFATLYQRDSLGLSLAQIGIIGVWAGGVGSLLAYPAGVYSDKKHPVRTILIALVAYLVFTPLNLIFLFRDFSPTITYYIVLGITMLTLPISTLYTAANYPLSMRLYPKERYGQYCAGEAMLRALGVMLGGVLAGLFVDFTKKISSGPEFFYYRYIPIWSWVFMAGSFVCMWVVFRYWKAYGGDQNYKPPAVGCVATQEREAGLHATQ